MIGTLLRRSFRHQRWLIGCIVPALVGFELLIIHIGAVVDRVPRLTELLDKLPAFLQDLVRTQLGEVSFPGFAAFGFEHPATMGMSLAYAVFLGTIPAGERDAGLLDLFLAGPLGRRSYLASVVVQVVLAALVLPACLLLGAAIALGQVDSPKALGWTSYLPSAAGLSGLLLAWGGIALLLSTGGQRRGRVVGQVVAAVFASYLVDVLGKFSSVLDPLQWLTPFHYFDPIGAALRPDASQAGPLVLAAVFGLAAGAAFLRFDKHDL